MGLGHPVSSSHPLPHGMGFLGASRRLHPPKSRRGAQHGQPWLLNVPHCHQETPLSPSPGCAEVAKFPRNPRQNQDQQHKAPQAVGRDPLRALQGTEFTPNPGPDVLGSAWRSGRALAGPTAGSVPLPRCGGEQKGQTHPWRWAPLGLPTKLGATSASDGVIC